MKRFQKFAAAAAGFLFAGFVLSGAATPRARQATAPINIPRVSVQHALKLDVSAPLASVRASSPSAASIPCFGLACGTSPQNQQTTEASAQEAPVISLAGAAVEQTSEGDRPALPVEASIDGLGVGFQGPQGNRGFYRNPSDNSLAVGPNDIVQIVNSQFAIFSKKGDRYPETGKVLYGPVPTNAFFHGFGGPCAQRASGDAVVRYDQLAHRWLVVMPIFFPIPAATPDQPAARRASRGA